MVFLCDTTHLNFRVYVVNVNGNIDFFLSFHLNSTQIRQVHHERYCDVNINAMTLRTTRRGPSKKIL